MSSKTGQAICAGINRHITHPTGRARSNAIAHSGRYVALNPAEIECFMSLQLDNDKYEYTIRFIELAIQCRQLEGMDHADVCGLRNDVIFYEAMFHLFGGTGVRASAGYGYETLQRVVAEDAVRSPCSASRYV
jgi:hypothetical protein